MRAVFFKVSMYGSTILKCDDMRCSSERRAVNFDLVPVVRDIPVPAAITNDPQQTMCDPSEDIPEDAHFATLGTHALLEKHDEEKLLSLRAPNICSSL